MAEMPRSYEVHWLGMQLKTGSGLPATNREIYVESTYQPGC